MSTQSKVVYDAGRKSLGGEIAKSLIKIVIEMIGVIIGGFIPLIGWIISVLCGIGIIVELVGFIMLAIGYSNFSFVLTETGIHCKNSYVDEEYTFNQIERVYNKGGKIMVETNIPAGNKKKIIQYVFAEDADAFCQAYEKQAHLVKQTPEQE